MIYLFVITLSSFLGVDFSKSFWGNFWRGDGLLTYFHLYGFFVIISFVWSKEWNLTFCKTIYITSLILSFGNILSMVLLHLFNIYTPNIYGITAFTFGQPNFLAGYLLLTLPFIYFLRQNAKVKNIYDFGLILVIICIFTTQSWGGLLGILLFVLILVLKNKNWNLLFGLFLGLTLLSYIFLFKHEGQIDYVFEGRQRIFTKAIMAFETKPLLGWGLANFDIAFDTIDWPIHLNNDVYVDKAHSSLLEILVASGLIGLISYLSLFVAVIYKLRKGFFFLGSWRLTLFTSLLLYLFHSQTNVISINEEMFFWLVSGIIASRNI